MDEFPPSYANSVAIKDRIGQFPYFFIYPLPSLPPHSIINIKNPFNFIMSRLASRQTPALLRTTRAPSCCAISRSRGARSLGAIRESARCYASDQRNPSSSSSSTPPPSSFRGQMLESVSSRIARERAEREKVAKETQNSAGSRRWATTFGML